MADPQTTKKKPYAGTYRSYVSRIVISIMQEAIHSHNCHPSKQWGGAMTQKEWRKIISYGTNEFMKAAKVRP